MEATTKDLRLHTRELLDAADRGEEVIITYRGKRRAKLLALEAPAQEPAEVPAQNPLFGLWRDRQFDIDAEIRAWRAPRQFDAV